MEEQGARESNLKKCQIKVINKKARKSWRFVNQIVTDTYVKTIFLQQVSIISRVGVAIPFHVSQQISIRRVQVLIA